VYSNIKNSYVGLQERSIGRITSKELGFKETNEDVDLIIVIPCFAEDEILKTLNSINACRKEDIKIEVIVLINESEDVETHYQLINEVCYKSILNYVDTTQPDWSLSLAYITGIPRKIAGVGTARKLAMDAASVRFQDIGKLENGIIVNLDADCTVSENYLHSILNHFYTNSKDELVSIAFQHRIAELENPNQREAIRQYEDYLRYFIGMQKWLGLPYAYQTIGSAFAVRARAYLQVGGMNKRKAGEDFYFIHKFTKKGSIATLDDCTVYPSGRTSFRVPFGTGRAVGDMMNDKATFYAYHPQSFYDLEEFVKGVESFYTNDVEVFFDSFPKGLQEYLQTQKFHQEIEKIRKNTATLQSFYKAFYQWFDAFRLMKYLHYVRDRYYPSIPIDEVLMEVDVT
jgi:hypothetical protein